MRGRGILLLLAVVAAGSIWVVYSRTSRNGLPPSPASAAGQSGGELGPAEKSAVPLDDEENRGASSPGGDSTEVLREVEALQAYAEPVLKVVGEAGEPITDAFVEMWDPKGEAAGVALASLEQKIADWRARATLLGSPRGLGASGELPLYDLRGLVLIVRAPRRSPEAVFVEAFPATRTLMLRSTPGFRGRVVDSRTNASVAGAELFAHPHVRSGETSPTKRLLQEVLLASLAVSNADGGFVLDGTAQGPSEMWCRAEGYPTTYLACAEPTEREIVVRLSAGGELSGIAVDADGLPLEGVLVGSAQRGARPIVAVETESDDEGAWTLPTIPEGPLSVSAHKDGFGAWKQYYEDRAEVPEFLEMVFEPQVSCSGIVLDEEGSPIEGALVQVLDATLHADLGSYTTEADGSWYFHWARTGDALLIYVSKKGYSMVYGEAATAPLADLPLVLYRPRTVSGRVVDSSGEPIPRARMRIVELDQNSVDELENRSLPEVVEIDDARGEFEFSWMPGPIELRVQAEGFRTLVRQDLVVPRGEDLGPLVLELVPAAAIRGRVVDFDGTPLSDVGVSFSDTTSSGRFLASSEGGTTTASDGSFLARSPPNDPFALWFQCSDRGPVLVNGLGIEDFPRDFVLEPSGSLRGRVQVPWRDLRYSGVVRLSLPESEPFETRQADEVGEFQFPALAPGTYVVELYDRWANEETFTEGTVCASVEIRSGEESFVSLSSASSGSIGGSVHRLDPSLQSEVFTVFARRAPGDGEWVARCPLYRGDRYLLRGLSPGSYEIQLVADEPGLCTDLRRTVLLDAAEAVSGIDFEVRDRAVRGLVRDAMGRPLRAAVALLRAGDTSRASTALTDEEGRYRILDASEGGYFVCARSPGFAENCQGPVHWPGTPSDFTHTLEPEAQLVVHVVHVVDDRAMQIADALVEARPATRPEILPPILLRNGTSGARFQSLPGGSCALSASARDHAPSATETVTLVSGSRVERTIVLERLGRLSVTVLDRPNHPRARSPVTLRRLDEVLGTLLTDTEGEAVFADLEPGSYVAHFESGPDEEVSVLPAETAEVVVQLGR